MTAESERLAGQIGALVLRLLSELSRESCPPHSPEQLQLPDVRGRYLAVSDVAELLSVSKPTARIVLRELGIAPIHLPGTTSVRYPADELEQRLRDQPRQGQGKSEANRRRVTPLVPPAAPRPGVITIEPRGRASRGRKAARQAGQSRRA